MVSLISQGIFLLKTIMAAMLQAHARLQFVKENFNAWG